MAQKDPRANSLVTLRGTSLQFEGRVDVLKDRPRMIPDGSGSFIAMDNQEIIFSNLISPPNGVGQGGSGYLVAAPFALGPKLASGPWNSPYMNYDPDALILFEEAAGKDTPLNDSGRPVHLGKFGMYAGNALPYKLPINQKLLSLHRSAQGWYGLSYFSESGTVVDMPYLAYPNPSYLRPFQPDLPGESQSGSLYIQGPIQPLWWSQANWSLVDDAIGRAMTLGTVGATALTASVPSPYIFSSGSSVSFAGSQITRFANGGAIRDLSVVQTLGAHFRPDGTLTRQDLKDGASTQTLPEYIEDSGRLINSPTYRIVGVNELSALFGSSVSSAVTSVTSKQYMDASSFHNFLLCSGTTLGEPDAYRVSFRFNSILNGAQLDYGMRRLASTETRMGFANSLANNQSLVVTGSDGTTIDYQGMEKDITPYPGYAVHNYYSPVHMYTMGGGKYKNRRQVSLAVPDKQEGVNMVGLVEAARQFSGHIDITPTYSETPWQVPGFFGFGYSKFPDIVTPIYSGSKTHTNGTAGTKAVGSDGEYAPPFIWTPEEYDPSVLTAANKSAMINYGLYHGGLGSTTVLNPNLANFPTFFPDSYADSRMILRDKPEDYDISPNMDMFGSYTSAQSFTIQKLVYYVYRQLRSILIGSSATDGDAVISEETGFVWNNVSRFYSVDTEFGRDFPVRIASDPIGTDVQVAAGQAPLVSLLTTSGSYRDFSRNTGVGGQWYSKPQADSFPFLPSNFHSSWNQVDSGDPWPWNVHGSDVPFQNFVRRNHLYSVNNNEDSLAGLTWYGPLSSAYGTGNWRTGFLYFDQVPQNTDLSLEYNSSEVRYPILAGHGVTYHAAVAPAAPNRLTGKDYSVGFKAGHTTKTPVNNNKLYWQLGHPSHGFEYIMSSSYTSNNLAEEVPMGLISMTTSGFDMPFSGSQDISIDLWVQFEKAITTEISPP